MDYDIVFVSIQNPSLKKKFRRKDGYDRLPNLGLMYLESYALSKGFKATILELKTENILEEFFRFQRLNSFKFLGFSAVTATINQIYDFLSKTNIDAKVVVGGPHVSVLPEEALLHRADYVVIGEGENTMIELLDGKDASSINGLAFLKDGLVIINKKRELIHDLDLLPFPIRKNIASYMPTPNQYKSLPVVHMLTSRGCNFNCKYCAKEAVFPGLERRRSVNNVIEEIKQVISIGAKEIHFWDECFTSNRRWVEDFCKSLIHQKILFGWTCFCRPDSVDCEILSLMKKAGCWSILYGVESYDDPILEAANKRLNLSKTTDSILSTKKSGIEVRLSFILGLPGDTPDAANRSLKYAIELDPDYVQFCLATPFPGTKFALEAPSQGTVSTDYSAYTVWDPVFVPYGYKDFYTLLKVQRKCFRKFYFRPAYLLKQIKKINSFSDLKRLLKSCFFLINYI